MHLIGSVRRWIHQYANVLRDLVGLVVVFLVVPKCATADTEIVRNCTHNDRCQTTESLIFGGQATLKGTLCDKTQQHGVSVSIVHHLLDITIIQAAKNGKRKLPKRMIDISAILIFWRSIEFPHRLHLCDGLLLTGHYLLILTVQSPGSHRTSPICRSFHIPAALIVAVCVDISRLCKGRISDGETSTHRNEKTRVEVHRYQHQ